MLVSLTTVSNDSKVHYIERLLYILISNKILPNTLHKTLHSHQTSTLSCSEATISYQNLELNTVISRLKMNVVSATYLITNTNSTTLYTTTSKPELKKYESISLATTKNKTL